MKRLPLTQEHWEKLAEYGLGEIPKKACACLRFEPGEIITREGMPIGELAVIVRGRAKIYRMANSGKTLILCYYLSEGMVGEVELMMNREVTLATAKALTELECIAIPYRDCLAALNSNRTFQRKLGTVVAGKLVEMSDSFMSAMLCSGEQRLCSYLLKNAYQGVFRDTLTDVSASVGISYRHLLRLLTQFCREGILEKQASGYWLADREELTRRSCGGEQRAGEGEAAP